MTCGASEIITSAFFSHFLYFPTMLLFSVVDLMKAQGYSFYYCEPGHHVLKGFLLDAFAPRQRLAARRACYKEVGQHQWQVCV